MVPLPCSDLLLSLLFLASTPILPPEEASSDCAKLGPSFSIYPIPFKHP